MRNMNVMRMGLAVTGTSLLAACGGGAEQQPADSSAVVMDGVELVVQEATRPAYLHASGVVEPVANATLSTKLMGAVTKVLVQEGDLVRAGQPLLHIDARDLAAQRARLDAARAEAEAVLGEAVEFRSGLDHDVGAEAARVNLAGIGNEFGECAHRSRGQDMQVCALVARRDAALLRRLERRMRL